MIGAESSAAAPILRSRSHTARYVRAALVALLVLVAAPILLAIFVARMVAGGR